LRCSCAPHRIHALAATATLRADPDPVLREVPIIIVTAYAQRHDQERSLAAGATAYLTKPIALRALRATIDDQVARAQALRGSPE
jgi:CheY-like chemotaxis protein